MADDLDLDECRKLCERPGCNTGRLLELVPDLIAEIDRLRIDNAQLREAVEPTLTKECGHADATIRNCPYASEINENDSQRCSCCSNCAHECAMDI